MANGDQGRQAYEKLAEWYDHEGQPKLRDWFLVLAADAALSANQPEEAERLRGRLLQRNPHHLLKPFASFAEALRSPDVQGYVADLRRTYPPAAAEQLLKTQQAKGPSASPEKQPATPPARAPEKPASAPRLSPPPEAPEEPELQVFRVRAEPEESDEPVLPIPRPVPPPRQPPRLAPPPSAPPTRPAPPPTRPAPQPVLRSRPTTTPVPEEAPARTFPATLPVPVAPPHYAVPQSEPEPEPAPAHPTRGAWVSTVLFALVLLLSLGLTGYTLARPFLPEDWFR